MRWICVAALLSGMACKKEETRSAQACLGYAAPPGWKQQPSRTGAGLVLVGPDVSTDTGIGKRDTLIVRYLPTGDMSLEAFKDTLVKMAGSPGLMGAVSRALPQAKAAMGLQGVEVRPPRVTAQTIAGRDGFRIETESTLTLNARVVQMVNTSWVTKFGRQIVQITAGAPAARAPIVRPIGDAFVASLNWNKCAAR